MTEFEEKVLPEDTDSSVDEAIAPEIEEAAPPTPPPESRTRATLRSFLRLALSLLIAFGLGALVVYFVYLVPAQKSLDQRTAELDEVMEQVDSLTDQLDEATQANQELEEELGNSQVQIILMGTTSDVRAANLAIANDDYAGALLYLKDAAQSLEQLNEVTGEEQKEVINALQDNLDEIEADIRRNPEAAKMSLDRLTANLIKLESSILK